MMTSFMERACVCVIATITVQVSIASPASDFAMRSRWEAQYREAEYRRQAERREQLRKESARLHEAQQRINETLKSRYKTDTSEENSK